MKHADRRPLRATTPRQSDDTGNRRQRWLLIALGVIAVAGIVARLAVAMVSTGTNDVTTWESFATSVRVRGLGNTYVAEKGFNHPPLMGLMASLIAELDARFDLRFAFWFKLPGILAEAGTTLLIRAIVARRATALRAATVAALYAWNPCSIAVSGYHGSTDSIYPMFVLMSAWLVADRQSPLAGGLALGAALNVKLIPIVVVPAMLLAPQSWRDRGRFAIGLSIALLPFLFALIGIGTPFARNVLGYNPPPENWGIMYLLAEVGRFRMFPAASTIMAYWQIGRYVIVLCVVLASLLPRSRRYNRYEISALALSIALVLAPSFGIQYVVAVCAALFVVDLRAALVYSWLAGTFVFLIYAAWLRMTEPYLFSVYSGIELPGSLFGLLAWASLLGFTVRLLARR